MTTLLHDRSTTYFPFGTTLSRLLERSAGAKRARERQQVLELGFDRG
jgi:hypothetical protein